MVCQLYTVYVGYSKIAEGIDSTNTTIFYKVMAIPMFNGDQ